MPRETSGPPLSKQPGEKTYQVLVSVTDRDGPGSQQIQPQGGLQFVARKSAPGAPRPGPSFKPPRVSAKKLGSPPKTKTPTRSKKARMGVLTIEEEEGTNFFLSKFSPTKVCILFSSPES